MCFWVFSRTGKVVVNDVWKNNRRDRISQLFLSVFMSVRHFPVPPPPHTHTHTTVTVCNYFPDEIKRNFPFNEHD